MTKKTRKRTKKSLWQRTMRKATKRLKRRAHRLNRSLNEMDRLAFVTFIFGLSLFVASLFIFFAPHKVNDQLSSTKGHPRRHAMALPSLYAQANCKQGRVLTFVAHEDDDLLFMNPDMQQSIKEGLCMRTVYVTAGDDGRAASYWHGRALGAEAAYATMADAPDNWTVSEAIIESHSVDVAVLKDRPTIVLTFLHLPDGGPSGNGFLSHETLAALRTNKVSMIHTVDGKSSYNRAELTATLDAFMSLDKPTVIRTQAYSDELANGDHSDHEAVGYFVDLARASYRRQYAFISYIAYQIGHMPVNLSDELVAHKTAVFQAYERYDAAICNTTSPDYCPNQGTYQEYLSRQYVYSRPQESY